MTKALITLNSSTDRERACDWARRIATGTIVEFREAKRSLPQNALLWCLLTDLSVKAKHEGKSFTPDEWKILCMYACGNEVQVERGLDGRLIPWGQSTSKLNKEQFGALIEFIYSYGAERGIEFSEPKGRAA